MYKGILIVLCFVCSPSFASAPFSMYQYDVGVDNMSSHHIKINISSETPSGIEGFHMDVTPALNFDTWDSVNVNIKAYGSVLLATLPPEKSWFIDFKIDDITAQKSSVCQLPYSWTYGVSNCVKLEYGTKASGNGSACYLMQIEKC